MATRTKKSEPRLDLATLGEEGDTCAECGAGLATDQRYCLNCGTRRGGSRLEYEQMLFAGANSGGGAIAPAGAAPVARIPAVRDWSPITAVGSIAVLGVMLLLGVLIGKDDNNNNNTTQVTAAPATATTAAAPAATPTATPADAGKAKQAAAAAAAAAAPAGGAVKGGTGDTSGIPTAAAPSTGKAASDASKNSPDQVATSGAPAQQDPNGQAGGGSGATVIK